MMRIEIHDEGASGALTVRAMEGDSDLPVERIRETLTRVLIGLGDNPSLDNGTAGEPSQVRQWFADIWEELKRSYTENGCKNCGGPHLAFQCPQPVQLSRDEMEPLEVIDGGRE
ncbi:MAG: hypothetical protein ACE5FM_02570 [Methyloligellaceae bacterium]